MSKNLIQVDGGQITDPTGGIIYIGYPDGGSPYGYSDAYISVANLQSSLQSQITTNTGDILINASDISELENINSLTYYKNRNSDFQITLPAWAILDTVVLCFKASDPKVKIGTTSGGDEILFEKNVTQQMQVYQTLYAYGGSSDTLYVSITGGTVTVATFVKQLDSGDI
jgi:hypothetical protein